MNSLRVPPAVDFAFEKAVNLVLEVAAPDYDALPGIRTELMEHLRERWRQEIEKGGSTDSAEQAALEAFGDPQVVGRSMRLAWWKRVLKYRRCRTERHLWFILSYLVSNVFLVMAYATESDSDFTFGFYIGSFLLVAYAIGAMAFIRKACPFRNIFLRALWRLRHIGWFFIANFAFQLFIHPILLLSQYKQFTTNLSHPSLIGTFVLGWLLIWGACWFSLLCFWKEVSGLLYFIRSKSNSEAPLSRV